MISSANLWRDLSLESNILCGVKVIYLFTKQQNLDQSKLKAFAYNKITSKKLKFVLGGVTKKTL